MRRSVVVLAVLVGVLAGCAGPAGNAPVPADPAPTVSAAPTTSAAPTVVLPLRPREVRLDGFDPCTLLTEADRAELGLDGDPVFDVGPSGLYGGATAACTTRGFEPRAISVGVELSVTAGVEVFLRPGVPSEITPIEVQGFPALIAVPVTIRDFCTVVVDVAPGQLVDIQAADGGRVPPLRQPELCVDAERIANVVMRNLLAAR